MSWSGLSLWISTPLSIVFQSQGHLPRRVLHNSWFWAWTWAQTDYGAVHSLPIAPVITFPDFHILNLGDSDVIVELCVHQCHHVHPGLFSHIGTLKGMQNAFLKNSLGIPFDPWSCGFCCDICCGLHSVLLGTTYMFCFGSLVCRPYLIFLIVFCFCSSFFFSSWWKICFFCAVMRWLGFLHNLLALFSTKTIRFEALRSLLEEKSAIDISFTMPPRQAMISLRRCINSEESMTRSPSSHSVHRPVHWRPLWLKSCGGHLFWGVPLFFLEYGTENHILVPLLAVVFCPCFSTQTHLIFERQSLSLWFENYGPNSQLPLHVHWRYSLEKLRIFSNCNHPS